MDDTTSNCHVFLYFVIWYTQLLLIIDTMETAKLLSTSDKSSLQPSFTYSRYVNAFKGEEVKRQCSRSYTASSRHASS